MAFDYRINTDGHLVVMKATVSEDDRPVTINGACVAYVEPAENGGTRVVFAGGADLVITEPYETVRQAVGFRYF